MRLKPLVLLLLVSPALIFLAYVPRLTPMVVLSGSMVPLFNPGDIVLLERVNGSEVHVGDVVAFRPPGARDENTFVTHRIVGIVEENGTRYFRTKGDNNEDEDPFLVPGENVYGKAVFSLPYLGYLTRHNPNRRERLAFYFLTVLVPGVILILGELPKLLYYSPRLEREALKLSTWNSRKVEELSPLRLLTVFVVSLVVFTLLLTPSYEGGLNGGRLPVLLLGAGDTGYVYLPPGEAFDGKFGVAVNAVLPVMWLVRAYGVNPFIVRALNLILSGITTLLLHPIWLKEEPKFKLSRRRNKYAVKRVPSPKRG
ncbi:signal peptidase I [Palaeococcus ferrophilus]|uniref:signal peptidase I n=1 Tax=Palaeococcus ferrophilus TaxID=83868 RepID=UPI0006986F2A|nr:signal peptidase I [Palaeococcus ferrophilus]